MKNGNKKKAITMLSVVEIENRIHLRKVKVKFQNARLEKLTDKFIKLNEVNNVNYKKLRKVKIQRGRLKSKIQHIKNEIIILEMGNVEKESLIKQSIKKFQNIPYKKQKEIYGMLFLLPWIIGFIMFFALPMFTTVWWSLNEMAPKLGGGFNFTYS
ncbi:MAG: sugar ABC transporter permease, partial [Tenericutes bacterium]|nr:sugar ABC transporter permease [Mycoplasmatota bacterium]